MKNKIPYLVGAVLGIVIVIAVVLVKTGGRKTDDELQTAETDVIETVEKPEEPKEEPKEAETEEPAETVAEEESAQEEPQTEPEPMTEKVIPPAVYIKSMSLENTNDYTEYWFDGDGDVIKEEWQRSEADGGRTRGELAYQYATDENGNKRSGDTVFMEELLSESNLIGYSNSLPAAVEYDSAPVEGEGWVSNWKIECTYDEKNRLVQSIFKSHDVNSSSGDESFSGDDQKTVTYETAGGQTTVTAMSYDKKVSDDEADECRIWTFDGNGRLLVYESSYGRTDQYEYSPDGRLLRAESSNTDEEGNQSTDVTTWEYDAGGNMTKKMRDGSEGEVREYDENGNMTKVKSYNDAYIWEYDDEGRVTDKTGYFNRGFESDSIEEFTIAYEYDARGRRQFIRTHKEKDGQAEDIVEEFCYGEEGNLEKILRNGAAVVVVAYNEQGAPTRITCDGNGAVYNEVYDLLPPNLKYIQYIRPEMQMDLWNYEYREQGAVPNGLMALTGLEKREIVIEYQ